jgi:UDP-glucuronate 4-epimerase
MPLQLLIIALVLLLLPCTDSTPITADSVVLITGAAGFVGSHLALALHRTYQPKHILLVDSIATTDQLALHDLRRQRIFHVLQILGPVASFYRADFRPSIPEYFDVGQVPLLDTIFQNYKDTLSHVIHLADDAQQQQVISRRAQDIRAGRMESLLEQLRKHRRDTGRTPHFLYASSYQVYDYFHTDSQQTNFSEDDTITTPSSLKGASKLLDELLAKSYYDQYGIVSLGLRFFPIYGPWSNPGTPLYEMAESIVTSGKIQHTFPTDDLRDYVYVEDAVDAILAAMQVPLTAPMVINVGSGQGTSLYNIAQLMQQLMAQHVVRDDQQTPPRIATTAVASTQRATHILGFRPQVTLEQGIERLLSWHYDRAFPYGATHTNNLRYTIASCSALDKECLLGAPVFACASECAHERLCVPSPYDDVTAWTQELTQDCDMVVYTVALQDELLPLQSTHVPPNTCHVAFVSERSLQVRRLKQKAKYPPATTVVEEYHRTKQPLKHGIWTLVPLLVTDDQHFALPKFSPGAFFGPNVQKAVYMDPTISLTYLDTLLQDSVYGKTALVVGSSQQQPRATIRRVEESVQAAAYRMVKIGMVDKMAQVPDLDTAWMIHTLQAEDARLFRCDVLTELVQWNVRSTEPALELIVSLHDMWSRVLSSNNHRQLLQDLDEQEEPVEEEERNGQEEPEEEDQPPPEDNDREDLKHPPEDKEQLPNDEENSKEREEDHVNDQQVGELEMSAEETVDAKIDVPIPDVEPISDEKSSEQSAKALKVELDESSDVEAKVDAGKVEEQHLEQLHKLDLRNPNEQEDLSEDDEEENKKEVGEKKPTEGLPVTETLSESKDSRDTWMKVLSSTTSVQYYVRIVSPSKAGLIHLDKPDQASTSNSNTEYF